MTISSSDALPARSPSPLIVHSTCSAPAWIPASEFATASPRSLWQCTESVTLRSSRQRRRTSAMNAAYCGGQRVADGVGKVDRPSRRRGSRRGRHARRTRGRSGSRPRTRTRPRRRAQPRSSTAQRACSSTSAGSRPSFFSMWIGLVPSTMWMRERTAPASASARCVDVVRAARGRATRRSAPARRRATARTPSKSPGDAPAKPASMTSTPSRSSCSAISAFSCGCSAMPGDCSPSRNVVSKIWILRDTNTSFRRRVREDAPTGVNVGVCGYESRVFVCSP